MIADRKVTVATLRERISGRPFSAEAAIFFLDDMRKLVAEIDEPTVAISLRAPANLLRMAKAQERLEKKKYQSLLIEYIRQGLRPR